MAAFFVGLDGEGGCEPVEELALGGSPRVAAGGRSHGGGATRVSAVGIPAETAESYFRDNLHFTLGAEERSGLTRFYELCVEHGLVARGSSLELEPAYMNGCVAKQ